MYAEKPTSLSVGEAELPVVTPSIAAFVLLAVGKKALAAITTDFTFV